MKREPGYSSDGIYTPSTWYSVYEKGEVFFRFPEGTGDIATAWLSQVTLKKPGSATVPCPGYFFVFSVIIFVGRSVIFAGAPIASL